MKILSSFNHPQVVPNLNDWLIDWLIDLCWTQKILKNVGNQTVANFFHTMEVSGEQQLSGYLHFFQNIVFILFIIFIFGELSL